jgi:hypothetical protein
MPKARKRPQGVWQFGVFDVFCLRSLLLGPAASAPSGLDKQTKQKRKRRTYTCRCYRISQYLGDGRLGACRCTARRPKAPTPPVARSKCAQTTSRPIHKQHFSRAEQRRGHRLPIARSEEVVPIHHFFANGDVRLCVCYPGTATRCSNSTLAPTLCK